MLPRFLGWTQSQAQLRVISTPIPADISSHTGLMGEIHDVKILGYGPDDSTYDNSFEMRQKVR